VITATVVKNMDPPHSALVQSRQFFGEASRQTPRNRVATKRDHGRRYTCFLAPAAPGAMTSLDPVSTAYRDHYDAVRYVISAQFRIPDADADQIAQDVYLSFMRHHANVGDPRAWLVTTARNACLNHLRDRKLTEELPATLTQTPLDLTVRVDLLRILRELPARCRAILWSRFVDGNSAAKVAQECAGSTSSDYGRRLVYRCLSAARDLVAKRRSSS
jgi:RNA polymerase sigma factor (sigma-70 family)